MSYYITGQNPCLMSKQIGCHLNNYIAFQYDVEDVSFESREKKDINRDIPSVLSLCTSNLKMADIYVCHCFSTGAWRVSHNPLRCCSFPCAFDVNTWKTHPPACLPPRCLSLPVPLLPFSSLLGSLWSRNEKKKSWQTRGRRAKREKCSVAFLVSLRKSVWFFFRS